MGTGTTLLDKGSTAAVMHGLAEMPGQAVHGHPVLLVFPSEPRQTLYVKPGLAICNSLMFCINKNKHNIAQSWMLFALHLNNHSKVLSRHAAVLALGCWVKCAGC